MTFRNENQDTIKTLSEHYSEYPMTNYCPGAYRYSMLPCQNIHYETMPRYMEYDNDVGNHRDGFRQYYNRPYYPYSSYPLYNPYPPYNYPPYYDNYYERPYYNPYFDYGYEVPFLTGLFLGSFF